MCICICVHNGTEVRYVSVHPRLDIACVNEHMSVYMGALYACVYRNMYVCVYLSIILIAGTKIYLGSV